MLGTHIAMGLLIIHLILILILVLRLISLMDLTIVDMILVHERTTSCLDALVTAHVLIVVIVSRVGMVSLLESFSLTLSPDTWTIHIFPIVLLVQVVERLRCKRQ
jgi:hypothetical protein